MPFFVSSLLVGAALALSPTRLTRAVAPPAVHLSHTRSYVVMGRKPGVEEPSELAKFVEAAGDKLIVVDVRNTDFEEEPGDAKTNEKAPIGAAARALAVNVIYDRKSSAMDLSKIPADRIAAGGGKESVPIITHCGGGGRGQKAKDYLEANGFGNVKNGGGPEDEECWAVFGSK